MALPAMITGFGEQSANYGAVVGQSLQQLGQQVGQQLAMREYQKQAQAALPALQQTYTSAMDKIQSGNVTEGYRDILNAQLQFGSSQNPFIAQMNQMAGSVAEQAASNYMKTKLYEMQYGRTGAGGGTAQAMPGVDASRYGFNRTAAPSTTVTQGGPPSNPPSPETIVEPAEGLPLEAEFVNAEGDVASEGGTPQQNEAARNVQELFSLPPEQQASAVATYGTSQYDPNQFEVEKIPGLNKYLPGFEAFLVPKKEWIENKARMGPSGFTSESAFIEGRNRENFYKQDGTKANLDKAISVMQDKKLTDLFKAFNNDIFAMRSAATQDVQDGETVYTIVPPGAEEGTEPTRITLPQYDAIKTIAGIAAATAQNAGGTPALFKEPPAKAPAPAAGGAKPSLVEIRDGATAPSEGAAAPATPVAATTTFSKDNPFAKQAKIETRKAEVGGKQAEREKIKTELKNIETQIKVMESREKAPNRLMPGFEAAMGTQEMQMTAAEKAQKWEQLKAEKARLEKILRTTTGFRRG